VQYPFGERSGLRSTIRRGPETDDPSVNKPFRRGLVVVRRARYEEQKKKTSSVKSGLGALQGPEYPRTHREEQDV
jgi:hypothetical protein